MVQVIVEFGKLGGKEVQRKATYSEPKNIGRSNETTDCQQAVLDAKSKWEKQVRLGYRETKKLCRQRTISLNACSRCN